MIAHVQGIVVAKEDNHLSVSLGPIALNVFVPSSLLASVQVGEKILLHTHLHIRESEWSLFGFREVEERTFFRLLLDAPGVGPKLALSALSTLSPAAITRAVQQEQPALLTQVPGIGKKSAERIVFALKDKLPLREAVTELSPLAEVDMEVVEALTTLGYSVLEAQRAVQGLPADLTTLEDRLRAALSRLA